MRHMEIYNELLVLLNRGDKGYSTEAVAERLPNSDDDDVREASEILEQRGILKSIGNGRYAFVSGVEPMREFIVSCNRGDEVVNQVEICKMSPSEIQNATWSFVAQNVAKPRSAPYRRDLFRDYRRKTLLFGGDDDDDGIEGLWNDTKPEKPVREILDEYFKKIPSFDKEKSSFRPNLGIVLPDGSPFELYCIEEEEVFYLSDNTLLFDRLLFLALENDVKLSLAKEWIDYCINKTVEDSFLANRDGAIVYNVSNVADDDDMNNAVAMFVKAYENFFTYFNDSYKKTDSDDVNEFLITRDVNSFVAKNLDIELSAESEDEIDSHVDRLIRGISLINTEIRRSHALDLADKLVLLAKSKGLECLAVFEALRDRLTAMTELHFKIVQRLNERVFN